jgi:hypothetical protein
MALKAYSLAQDGALHLTPHFRVREFACRDGSDPIFVEEELAALLEAIRLHFGCPVAITSGFRTAAHNASIPGASPHSQHLYGRAADFRWRASAWRKPPPTLRPCCPAKEASGATRPAKAAPAAGYIWTPAAPKPAGRAESGPSSDLKFTAKIRKENPL